VGILGSIIKKERSEVDSYTKKILLDGGVNEFDIEEKELGDNDLPLLFLAGCDLRGFYIFKMNLACADLVGADLRDTKLQADFAYANFRGADLRGATLIGGKFNHANFIGADLRGVNIANSECYEADFSGADLRGAIFGNEHYRSNFTGADMRGIDYMKGVFDTCIMDGVQIGKSLEYERTNKT
jgi:uncharacterized protein YjbI with pentapeptide repeats